MLHKRHLQLQLSAIALTLCQYSRNSRQITMATSISSSQAPKSLPLNLKDKDTPTNPRGIPLAPFVDRVEDYVSSRQEVEGTLRSFQEMISKYQFMELNTQRRLTSLQEKTPDIQKTLDMVRFLAQSRDDGDAEPLETTFELNDTLYARALVPPTDEVYLWLGANVMLSYPLAEAQALLQEKLDGAQTKMGECEEDLDFLREQITTMEVATARVYNHDVGLRRREREEGGGDDKDKTKD